MENLNNMEHLLRRAIGRQELTVVYQPMFDMETEQVNGFEALLRWTRKDGTMVSPDIFIPLAEQKGLITPITFFVAEHVLSCMQEWHAQGMKQIPVSINISRVDLCMPDFPELFIRLLEKYQIESQDIELEITETALVTDRDKIAVPLSILRTHGVRIAIDDFGIGYSSLSCLKTLPLDVIKIDQMFLRDIVTDTVSQSILKGILGIAKVLNLKVVYEGIETEEQIQYLKQFGHKIAQGFFYAGAMCRQELEFWLQSKEKFTPSVARRNGIILPAADRCLK